MAIDFGRLTIIGSANGRRWSIDRFLDVVWLPSLQYRPCASTVQGTAEPLYALSARSHHGTRKSPVILLRGRRKPPSQLDKLRIERPLTTVAPFA
jgi:hypothetical protein